MGADVVFSGTPLDHIWWNKRSVRSSKAGATVIVKPISGGEDTFRSSPDMSGTFLLSRLSSLALDGAMAGTFLAIFVPLPWVRPIHEYKSLPLTPLDPGPGVFFALILR